MLNRLCKIKTIILASFSTTLISCDLKQDCVNDPDNRSFCSTKELIEYLPKAPLSAYNGEWALIKTKSSDPYNIYNESNPEFSTTILSVDNGSWFATSRCGSDTSKNIYSGLVFNYTTSSDSAIIGIQRGSFNTEYDVKADSRLNSGGCFTFIAGHPNASVASMINTGYLSSNQDTLIFCGREYEAGSGYGGDHIMSVCEDFGYFVKK